MKYSVNETKEALGELQTTLRWKFSWIKAPAAVTAPDKSLMIRVQSSGVPQATEETNKVELQGHVINFPAKTTKNGEIPLTLVEGTDAKVAGYFYQLCAARWSGDGNDTKGVQAPTADLKGDGLLELLGPNDQVTQSFKMIGAMCRFEHGMSLAQTADPVVNSVMLEYDDFHVNAGGATW